jgi:hypothetical protein
MNESKEAEVTSGGPLLSLLRCRLPGESRDTGVVKLRLHHASLA